MRQQIIRQPNGKLIGKLNELSTRIEARSPRGTLLGWYDKKTDTTRLANGSAYAKGNAVTSLFEI